VPVLKLRPLSRLSRLSAVKAGELARPRNRLVMASSLNGLVHHQPGSFASSLDGKNHISNNGPLFSERHP
jgi:hypothetical protein